MKLILLLGIISFTTVASALPIFNINAASGGENLIIWPDHKEPYKFYYLPKGLKTVDQYRWGFELKKSHLNVGFTFEYNEEAIRVAIKSLETRYPGKRINLTPVFLEEQQLVVGDVLQDYILDQNCRTNTEADSSFLFYCQFKLSYNGEQHLVPFLISGSVLALSSFYKINGYVQNISGETKPYVMEFGLPVKMNMVEILK